MKQKRPARKSLAMNAGLFILAAIVTFGALDVIIGRSSVFEGIAPAEYLLDEFRIRFLKLPDFSMRLVCKINDTVLIPDCEAEGVGITVRIPRFKVKINSHGFRDKEYELEKPVDTYRIFVLGDSFAFGFGVNNDEPFPEVIEHELNARYNSTFEVLNLAIWGSSTDKQHYRLLQYLDFSPDLIVLQTHPNDMFECAEMKEEINAYLNQRQPNLEDLTPEEGYSLQPDYVMDLSLERRCSCVWKYFGLILNESRNLGIPLLAYEIDVDRNTSCLENLRCLDYHYLQARYFGRQYRISRLDGHFNAKGHQRAASDLLQSIIPIINSTRPEMLS